MYDILNLFEVNIPKTARVPILISFPHSGFLLPEALKSNYREEAIDFIDDTDWFLPELYDFAEDLGITTIKANYSRWLIDLNRNPDSKPLYNDGRIITALCTTTDFLGNPIYKEEMEPDDAEVERRKATYFKPYYTTIQEILDGFKKDFGTAILYDSHSIRSVVPTIQPNRFPDMILGTADGNSASENLCNAALKVLKYSKYDVSYNHPFKGGNITRHFGRPNQNQHALQLERCKDLYMDATEKQLDVAKAKELSTMLKSLFVSLIETIK